MYRRDSPGFAYTLVTYDLPKIGVTSYNLSDDPFGKCGPMSYDPQPVCPGNSAPVPHSPHCYNMRIGINTGNGIRDSLGFFLLNNSSPIVQPSDLSYCLNFIFIFFFDYF